jgi:hypothetical protein
MGWCLGFCAEDVDPISQSSRDSGRDKPIKTAVPTNNEAKRKRQMPQKGRSESARTRTVGDVSSRTLWAAKQLDC